MKLRRVFIIAALLTYQNCASAQTPVYYLNFDDFTFKETIIPKDKAYYGVDLQQSQYAKGLSGKALDLSANAILRRPVKLDRGTLRGFDEKTSFSVQIWVKTLPNAKQGTPIMGNKKADDLVTAGWQIYTQENGAWALILNDGKHQYDYKPTAERQRVNDGKWHQIAFTVDRKKQEVWMFLDGKNVAIYNTPNLGTLETQLSTVIGGSDEKWEYGAEAQWNSFNGYIDEVKVWNTAITAAEVQKLYTQFYPNTGANEETYDPAQLKVLSWNIMNGGNEYGKAVGIQRIIETIKSTHADIVGLVETYGSGTALADSLGYYFYLISSNLSIMSRYPITETIKEFHPSNFGGLKLNLGPNKKLIYFDTWLNYLPDVDGSIREKHENAQQLIQDEEPTRHSEIKEILKLINPYLKNADNLPVIMGGDFNMGSHLDWTAETKAIHYNLIVEWPESKEMLNAGFTDSYRLLHINPLLDPGLTWGVRAATSTDLYGVRDRIDFIYYKGKDLNPIESRVIDYHPVMFPSDHAAVITVFQLK
ncbi:LamG-like jellyroll fold domain-containing protein [Mucilaginibacter sp. X5P1]|uniref:LamG-like jellyroll fold domain-containing protein n=1 Tax=Mucilaginibacter sp. X5P1 TaxID=2723088 RepID=UPI00162261BB|nr:LamG-like jellyroll fold domain-containing protein [Mucilaginibacter sp. X5P1]MBB6139857.1 endonuclease/exonuclease/phosphatase family metal-dependent hydrolase [Mucilaginibacter sp. X5P1]